MNEEWLNGLRVALLATDGYGPSELLEPRRALDAAGAATQIVSTRARDVVGADRDLHSADPDDYDALVLPGAIMNLSLSPHAAAFVRSFFEAGKPVAALRRTEDLSAVNRALIQARSGSRLH
jgi:protease I